MTELAPRRVGVRSGRKASESLHKTRRLTQPTAGERGRSLQRDQGKVFSVLPRVKQGGPVCVTLVILNLRRQHRHTRAALWHHNRLAHARRDDGCRREYRGVLRRS